MAYVRLTSIAAGILTVLLTASCSGGDDPGTERTSTRAATHSPAAKVRLSKTWTPKLEKATGTGGPSVCKQVGAAACTKYITHLTETVFAVDDAIDETDDAEQYPRSKADIDKVTRASDSYAQHGCADSDEPTLGNTLCANAVQDLLVGPGMLMNDLGTDEINHS